MKEDNLYETIPLKNGHTLKIYYDTEPLNPRTDWDNIGHMCCWHTRYQLGDCKKGTGSRKSPWEPLYDDQDMMFAAITGRHPEDPEFEAMDYGKAREIIRADAETKAVILPLRLYDHSGITMSVGSGPSEFDPGGWDSGQVGWIYATKEEFDKQGWTKEWINGRTWQQVLTDVLTGEVEVYDQMLTGDVYGFRIMKTVQFTKTPLGGGESVIIDEEEEVDSCWGFFGSNWRENGIIDNIDQELIPEEVLS
jgi:hypothetical protein